MARNAANNPVGPLNPVGHDGQVEIREPPETAMHMSAEEADMSGIRLLDAAAEARRQRGVRRTPED
jgi:hypothetical protein